mmetsp:Transcript_20364/g.61846  ORF Transcript_20364/g.61846 Transcript_20364/m.61846 type:complete len:186 (-) Transcript_20364:247-804(-)
MRAFGAALLLLGSCQLCAAFMAIRPGWTLARAPALRLNARRRFFATGGPADDDEPRQVSREAEILESIEGTAPTNFIVPPFLRTIFYGIFGLSAAAGMGVAVMNMGKDAGKSVTDIGINAVVLAVIIGVAIFDNKQRSASLQEVQRQLDTEYLKKDSPFYFDNQKRAEQARMKEEEGAEVEADME